MSAQIPYYEKLRVFYEDLKKQPAALPPMSAHRAFLQAAVAAGLSKDEARQHFVSVWTAVNGQLLRMSRSNADQLETEAAALSEQIQKVEEIRAGHPLDTFVRSDEPAQWTVGSVVRVAVPALQCLGLLAVGWFAAMATLTEASDIFPVFDDVTTRATFSLLPALGITAGWKLLGAWQKSQVARDRYWRAVTRWGLVLGVAWVALFSDTLGAVAWEDASGGGLDDLPTGDEPEGAALSGGVAMVTTGMLAETLLAASCWRDFDNKLLAAERYAVADDPYAKKLTERRDEAAAERAEVLRLRGEFLGRIEALDNSLEAYAGEGVAALTPRWMPPEDGGQGGGGAPQTKRPDVPDTNRNGSMLPEQRDER